MKILLCTGLVRASLVLLAALPAPNSPGMRDRSPTQPRHVLSRSGEYDFCIEAVGRNGCGPAYHTLYRSGQALWMKKLPFTFQDAVVSNSGTTAGYAYTRGWYGGDFVVTVFDSSGEVLGQESEPAKPSRVLHSKASLPVVRGLFVQEELNRAIFRIYDYDVEGVETDLYWRAYDMTTGVRQWTRKREGPPGERVQSHFDVQAIALPNTSLILVNWRVQFEAHSSPGDYDGTVFALLDPEDRIVWQLDLPEDCGAVREAFARNGFISQDFLLLETETGVEHRFVLEHDPARGDSWNFGFSPEGRELWLVEKSPLRLHRFALSRGG